MKMIFYTRLTAFLLALLITAVITFSLQLVEGITITVLILIAVLSLIGCYLLVYSILKFFIFNELNNIIRMLEEIQKGEFEFARKDDEHIRNPIKKLNKEIYLYAQAKQKELDEMKRMELYRKEFVADISHELKTPLFAAQGFVHTLLDGAISDPKVRNKFLKKAAKSLTGLEKLVQDLLTISQIEAGTLRMNFSVFDLRHVINEVFDQFEGKAEKKDLQLCFSETSQIIAMVYGDRQKISQVILNIISNAIKYSHDKNSKIIVDLEDISNSIKIAVKDNGMGIPPEDIERVFERFYRVDKSRSKDTGGTGLGLSIVKHILEAHNQSISVESTMGQGSTFTFKLPKAGKINEKVTSESES